MGLENIPSAEVTSEECVDLVGKVFRGEEITVAGKPFKLDLSPEELEERQQFLKQLAGAPKEAFAEGGVLVSKLEAFIEQDKPPRLMIDTGISVRERSLYGGAWAQRSKEATDRS